MLFEPTTLAATATALAAALETHGCDPRIVFGCAGLDIEALGKPGARYSFARIQRLWAEARLATGDPCIGLYAARWIKPQALHALGLSWMASRTLYDGFRRMARYSHIANTSLKITVSEDTNQVRVAPEIDARGIERAPEGVDATLAFIVSLCRFITNRHFAPAQVTFRHAANDHVDQYVEFFAAPVHFGRREDALWVDVETARQPVPAGNEELAGETDRIAERYLATLEPRRVQDRVREVLMTLLPSGEADQRAVARSMNRSVSALQRQLRAEGASYRAVLDETRQTMATRLVRERRYSLGQIAYLLGFADQANFSRAFKRWTGEAPSEYR
jgi:AraC-like DNA-binding protein